MSEEPGYSVSCGIGPGRRIGPRLEVSFNRYRCPWCAGTGRWASEERCMQCAGTGVTDDPSPGADLTVPDGVAVPDAEAVPLPRPPAVMKSPCIDCAFRPGSPEEDSAVRPDASQPFFCHHGMHRIGDSYQAAAWVGGMPLGYMVCAGWWAMATGQPGPEAPFRDPGGADRSESTP